MDTDKHFKITFSWFFSVHRCIWQRFSTIILKFFRFHQRVNNIYNLQIFPPFIILLFVYLIKQRQMNQSINKRMQAKKYIENQDPNVVTKKLKEAYDSKDKTINKKVRQSINQEQKYVLDLLRQQDNKQYKTKRENLILINCDKINNKKHSLNMSSLEFEKVLERMKAQEKKSNQIKKEMVANKQKELLKYCTFAPMTGKNKSSKSFEHFLKEQEMFVIEKQKSIKRKKESQINQLSQTMKTSKPLNCKSKEALENKSKRRNCESHHQIRKQIKFKPQILKQSKELCRQVPIEELLYQDAKRRAKQKKQKKQQQIIQQKQISKQSFTSKQSIEFCATKLQRQFEKIFDSLNHCQHTHLLPNQCFLSFQEFVEVLQKFKYIRQYQGLSQVDKNKINQLWEVMGGYQYEGVSKIKIKKAFMTIEGFLDDKTILQDQTKKYCQVNFNNMNWQEINRLISFKNQFNIFNANKKSNVQRNLVQYDQFNYKPDILKTSIKLAESHRKRMFEQNEQKNLSLGDRYSINNYFDLKKKHVEQKNIQRKQAQQQQQIKKCPFKPSINRVEKIKTNSKHQLVYMTQRNTQVNERQAIFSMEINIKNKTLEKIIIYQGDTVQMIVEEIKNKYNISQTQQKNFEAIIRQNFKRISEI